jgi:ATP-binding protein involved in chromosome partitioning
MRVVTVASGKGGVGKSTVSLNLALALAERGRRVGLLDADLYGPDIPLMIGLTRQRRLRSWDLWRSSGPVRLEPVERFGIRVMSAGFLLGEDQTLAFAAPLVQVVLHQLLTGVAWGELDELLVDLPPGTADLQQQLLRLVHPAGAVIVVGPQDVAHLDARKVLDLLQNAGVPVPVLGGWRTSRSWPVPIAGSRSRCSRASPASARSGPLGWPVWVGCPWTPRWPPPAIPAGRCCSPIPPAARPRRCATSPAT